MTLLESSSSPPMKAYKKALQLPDELLKVPTSFLSKLDGFTDVDWGEKERGRHRGGIVNAKRKTELCRNWLNGFCAYGDKCAFAHGHHDLRHSAFGSDEASSSLDTTPKAMMHEEVASCLSPTSLALPPATYQVRRPCELSYIPCNAYVATGSCQNSSNCKFLHDPRIHSDNLIEPCEKALNYYNSVGSPEIGFMKWPEVVHDNTCSDNEKTTNSNCDSTFELSWITNTTKEAYISRCVYRMWYGLVEYIMEKNGLDKYKAVDGQAAHALRQLPVLQELKTRLTHPQVFDTITGCDAYKVDNKSHISCNLKGQELVTQNQKRHLYSKCQDVTRSLREATIATFSIAFGRESPTSPKPSVMERAPLQPARTYPGNVDELNFTSNSSVKVATNHPISGCSSTDLAIDYEVQAYPITMAGGDDGRTCGDEVLDPQ